MDPQVAPCCLAWLLYLQRSHSNRLESTTSHVNKGWLIYHQGWWFYPKPLDLQYLSHHAGMAGEGWTRNLACSEMWKSAKSK